MKEGEIVFEINSVGDKFYIIIEGEVLVYVKDEKKAPEGEVTKSKEVAGSSDHEKA